MSLNKSQARIVKKRILQVNQLLYKELGNILLREIDFPDEVFVTVTRVEAFPNLQEAVVSISVIPEERKKEVLRLLNAHLYHIQQIVNKRFQMRPVPKLRFETTRGTQDIQRVEELLDKIAARWRRG